MVQNLKLYASVQNSGNVDTYYAVVKNSEIVFGVVQNYGITGGWSRIMESQVNSDFCYVLGKR
jgi:hypothetical protein